MIILTLVLTHAVLKGSTKSRMSTYALRHIENNTFICNNMADTPASAETLSYTELCHDKVWPLQFSLAATFAFCSIDVA